MVPKTDDGRVLFLIPWLNRVILGTTEAPVEGLPVEPRPSREEVEYLLSHAGRYLQTTPRPEDVRSVFAGLRPLLDHAGVKSSARLSREHAVLVSDSGLVTVTGGKWTTYRVMAADAVDRASRVGGLPKRPCVTADLRLRGWTETLPEDGTLRGYGADRPGVQAVLDSKPGWDAPIHPELPIRAGEVAWAARHELARTVEDVLARRSRCLLLDAKGSAEAAPKVAAILAGELGFDEGWQTEQVRRFRTLAEGYILS
jgi:glycerol-3-phosphate dehydrogenase